MSDEVKNKKPTNKKSKNFGFKKKIKKMVSMKGKIEEGNQNEIFSKELFSDFGLDPKLLTALTKDNFIKSTEIQKVSFKPIITGKNCII